MLAIAGAKGGCGKTTTALGLAAAFARAGQPTLAVDADRQLPDLHATAGVEREPTIAALDRDANPGSLAQELPGTPEAGVLPGPKPDEQIDLEATLERLGAGPGQVLVDCPSGAGPDVIEPIGAADGVVVVTTGNDQSVSAAETTIDVARRLDVPVEGVVVTQCDEVPAALETRLDAPVLGAIPAVESPLSSDAVDAAYDGVADALVGGPAVPAPDPSEPEGVDRLSTGVPALDRALGGGVPPGSVVALLADPASQAELLCHRLTAVRGTLYLSTTRSDEVVRAAIESSAARVGSPTVRHLEGDGSVDEAKRLVGQLPDGSNLVVDPIDRLERADRGSYVAFLDGLKARMLATDSVAVLHCLRRPSPPDTRAATKHVADVVVDLRTAGPEATHDHRLAVSKFRAGRVVTDPIKLDLGAVAADPDA